tara:strand:+ start:1382 stop:1957 length:576 start_codon:yes stop_codon:yes gene_type:complete
MRFKSDIDIDLGDRAALLKHIKHIPASMRKVSPIRKHASGIYVTDIPYDPVEGMANIDYSEAEERAYFKLDLLNVHVYQNVKDEQHLIQLMAEPDWEKLKDPEFVAKLIHLNGQYYNMVKMPEPIDSVPRLAMFLSIIRPGKKHLIGLPWNEVAKTVWTKVDDGYVFKKAHAVGYAVLVTVHMNLLGHAPD